VKRLLFAVAPVAGLLLGACSNTSNAVGPVTGAQAAVAAEDPNTVVATVDGQAITLGELDKELGLREEIFSIRQQGLQRLVLDRLLEAEAQKRGLTKEKLLEVEVQAKLEAMRPSDEELKAAFEQMKPMMGPNAKFEDVKPMLEQQMLRRQQQQVMGEFVDMLRATKKVEIKLEKPEPEPVEVAATGPAKGGGEKAPVTIVEFSDFQCPFCSRVNATIDQVMKTYGDKVRLVFRDYPLPFHQQAPKAAEAAQCAHEQGKFWEMHDKLFANQTALQVADLKKYAGELGLDQAKFDGCLDSGKMEAVVKKNFEEGGTAGVEGTPAFFINGRLVSGAQPFEEFKRMIDKELTRQGVALPAEPAPEAAAQ
jgi:protein-disulfide isomerase